MADFRYAVLAQSPERLNVIATKLGSAKGEKITDKDIKKAMKLGQVSNFVFCQDGDELEGFLDHVQGGPTAGGYTFGGVARGGPGFRVNATVADSQTPNLKPGDLVVAADQPELGKESQPVVRKGAPKVFVYRVITTWDEGKPGTTVVLERC